MMKKIQLSRGEWLILLVVALALLMRLWPLDYMNYSGDSQKISLAAYRFIHEGEIPLYGYFNIVYYGHYGPAPIYLFTIFALISTSPFSLVLFTILLSTVTTYVLYRIGRDFWNRSVGFIAALLWAASHFSAVTSRWPYIANFTPFFVSLFLYSLLALLHKRKPAYYGILFFSLGIILQLHVTAFPVLLLAIPALFFRMPLNRKWILAGWCILIILFLPYLYYEVSNGFAETRQILQGIGALREGKASADQRSDSNNGRFFWDYANPWKQDSYIKPNPFLQSVANIGQCGYNSYFCEEPAQYSSLTAGIGRALRTSANIAWLLFLLIPFLFGLWLVRQRNESDSIEFKGLILLPLWFFSSLMLQSIFPWHALYHYHSLLISTILLWAVGWAWLLPSLAGRYKQATRIFVLLFALILVIVNGVGWAAFHINNPRKECISNEPTLSALEAIAEVLAEDQRFLQQPDETLAEILSSYDTATLGKLYGIPYVLLDAVRRREHMGEQFANLSGRYILLREQSLPFRLAPALSEKRIGSYTLIRQSPLINASSLVIGQLGNTRDIESARRIASAHLKPWRLEEAWPSIGTQGFHGCLVECPRSDFEGPDCQLCLGNSTVYLRIHLSGNRTARTALVVNEFVGRESHMIGAVYLNDEPLFYDGSLLVAGQSLRPQEILMDVTGRLNESTNLVEVLLFSQPGPPKGKQVRPDIFLLSGS